MKAGAGKQQMPAKTAAKQPVVKVNSSKVQPKITQYFKSQKGKESINLAEAQSTSTPTEATVVNPAAKVQTNITQYFKPQSKASPTIAAVQSKLATAKTTNYTSQDAQNFDLNVSEPTPAKENLVSQAGTALANLTGYKSQTNPRGWTFNSQASKFQNNLNSRNQNFANYKTTNQDLNLDSLFNDNASEITNEAPVNQTISQRISSAARTAYNTPGALVETLGGQGDFITGRKASLTSVVNTTGRVLNNAGRFTSQKVNDLYNSFRSAGNKKTVAQDATKEALAEVDATTNPTPEQAQQVQQAAAAFQAKPMTTLQSFNAGLQSLRTRIGSIFVKKAAVPQQVTNLTQPRSRTIVNARGIETTSWDMDNDGYTRQVVKNKEGQSTEIVEHPANTKAFGNFKNKLITNYKRYDITNPDANFQDENVVSSSEITDNHLTYKIYKNDGSYDAYNFYLKDYHDDLTNTSYKKGDIETTTSDPRQRSATHIKKDSSVQYQQAMNTVQAVIKTFDDHVISNQ